ncbi:MULTISPECIES: HEAT repeat domain-containing protein [unclassified Mycobacterium]|uniref:HEAT repeat domain-containing protein n=1 Tax=unclassified Mycobacterium TaxID=2642494 RepID=UPI000B81AD8A|nr:MULTISPECIES: HEAT repeat domain-containing protein [unclassified Mycobacterium]
MPEGDDWMKNLPARYHDGERGFDRRIMEELAAVGVPCYTLGDLSNRVPTIPQGIPIFVDWLNHIEERIPGPETSHRTAIRAGLIRNLNDSAARGNQAAVDALVNQLRRQPPLPRPLPEYADSALGRIATKSDFSTIAALIRDMPPDFSRSGLISYLGRVKTPEAQAIALEWLDTAYTGFAIKALVAMKAAGVRDRIAPYVEDANAWVRKSAQRAMERLPE